MTITAWPTVETVRAPSAQHRYQQNKKAKQEQLLSDVEKLKEKQRQKIELAAKPVELEPEFTEILNSDWFAEWLDDIGHKDPIAFAESVRYRLEFTTVMARFGAPVSRSSQFTRIIKELLYSHRWDSKAYRKQWARDLVTCTDAILRRRIIQKLATPKWANPILMARFHKLRIETERITGVRHDVDHIIPLQGVLVCGLNCEANLRVIPASENRSKSNKYIIE